MRVIMLTVFVCTVLNAFSMRQIHKSVELWIEQTERVMAYVRPEDRRIILDEIRLWRTRNVDQFPLYLRQFYKSVYEPELCSETFFHVDLLFHSLFYKYSTSDKNFETRVAKCMSIPYVRESQTGLAVEALIKRLENALHDQEKPKIKKWSHKNISATKPFDFSILDAFQPDDLDNVVSMNREWRDHHEDPEYDHGAAMYWFTDLDSELESALKDAKSKLVYIGQMYNHPTQQHRAWQILYDWREYFCYNNN